jgi:hypothetical protein
MFRGGPFMDLEIKRLQYGGGHGFPLFVRLLFANSNFAENAGPESNPLWVTGGMEFRAWKIKLLCADEFWRML